MQWFALGKTFANFHYAVFVRFSEETCSDEVPAECAEFIPYTTYPNTLYGLNGTDEYTDFSDRITAALHNCTNVDPFWARWGVCNMMFPRCLLGFELQLCQETCLGKSNVRLPVYIHTTTAIFILLCPTHGAVCTPLIVCEIIITNCIGFTDGVREGGCSGPSRDYLESLCMMLPDEKCLPAPEMNKTDCSDIEFDCGNGQCIPGLKLCDNGFDCYNGADELEW